MRIVSILYIVLSVAANFVYGNLTTFVLAALSFPALVWLLLQKKNKQRHVHAVKDVSQNTGEIQ